MRGAKLAAAIAAVALAAAGVVAVAIALGGAIHLTHGTSAGGSHPVAGNGGRQGGHGGMGAVSPAIGLRSGVVSPSAAGITAAKATLPKLTALQLAGQRVIYSYSGMTPPAGLLRLIRHGEAAGVIFFGGNIGTTSSQLTHFKSVVAKLRAANRASTNPVRHPLLLMTDQEGGAVRRLPGAPTLSEKQIGASSNPAGLAATAGRRAALNLRGYGLNVNLAPVLDVYRTAGNFIDQFGRSYSKSPTIVAQAATAFIKAQQAGHVAATAKHFPGLGAATRAQNTDARRVTLNLTLSQIRTIDERPYRSAIPAGARLVMLSWATYPAIDAKYPAGLSRKIVHGELRQRLGFAGVTVTDALEAGGLASFGSTANRAKLAAKAGMDLLLCSAQNYQQGKTAMNALRSFYLAGSSSTQAGFKAAAERVLALRATLGGS